MRRYVDWQNRLLAPESMARARFIEIPALHQTGLYRRAALARVGGFVGHSIERGWPLDIDFWMRWFELRLRVGRVPRVLYRWRQHARQSTRTSPLHRLEALRRCKAWYFASGPARGRAVDLFSVGRTLAAWESELRAAGVADVRRARMAAGCAASAARDRCAAPLRLRDGAGARARARATDGLRSGRRLVRGLRLRDGTARPASAGGGTRRSGARGARPGASSTASSRDRELLAGSSLRADHRGRVQILDLSCAPARIGFGIVRHPRPYHFSKQFHEVVELWIWHAGEQRLERVKGINLTQATRQRRRPVLVRHRRRDARSADFDKPPQRRDEPAPLRCGELERA